MVSLKVNENINYFFIGILNYILKVECHLWKGIWAPMLWGNIIMLDTGVTALGYFVVRRTKRFLSRDSTDKTLTSASWSCLLEPVNVMDKHKYLVFINFYQKNYPTFIASWLREQYRWSICVGLPRSVINVICSLVS